MTGRRCPSRGGAVAEEAATSFTRADIAALFRGGVENRALALELVCGADSWCNRHCKTSPVVLEGLGGQVWPNIGRKPTRKLRIENQQSAAERSGNGFATESA
jgi:hypothetical protein